MNEINDSLSTVYYADPDQDVVPRPDARVAARVEELLREQLFERGVNPAHLSPQDIMEFMTCALAPDNSMTYAWKGQPLLYVAPEILEGPDGVSVLWRMFTADDQLTDDHIAGGHVASVQPADNSYE